MKKNDSLVLLSDLDDLVIHPSLVDPENKDVFSPYNTE